MQRLIQRGGAGASWPCPPGMPKLIHRLLMQRGVSSYEEADAFLHPTPERLIDPFLLSDMERAVERILSAAEKGERACVFGDYDVDGVSASSLLSMFLKEIGLAVSVYIPSRHEEGYGLNENAVREIAKDASLLITVDCGISCADEVRLAQELGMGVIVTDHHRPGDRLPECIVINPLLNGYPFPSLCGAGVALKLVLAIAAKLEQTPSVPPGWSRAEEYIDLAALATVADIVPLTGENRAIVSLGLRRINESPRAGISALIHAAGLDGKSISAGNIGFGLAPRLNASGRLGDARRAMALLTAETEAEAGPIAQELEHENTNRRAEEQKIVDEALEKMKSYDLLSHRIIVISGTDWNPGVIGLAASRLATKYFYPVILLSARDGVCVGSCRSIPGVDIFAALSSCAELFVRFGGHRQAAGLTIEEKKIGEMLDRLDEYLWKNVAPEEYVPEVEYDFATPLCEATEEAVRQMDLLQPTGFGNPSPVLLSEATIESARAVGKTGAHLQLKLSDGTNELPAVYFGAGARAGEWIGEKKKILYAPQINVWRDRVSVQCEVKNVLESSAEMVFCSFKEKYNRYLRTYLTEVLYNIDLNSTIPAMQSVEREVISGWLRETPQGTVIVCATEEGAENLYSFLRQEGLEHRADARAGSWSADAQAFNSVFLCPAGEAPVRYRRVVLWDAPPEAFARLPEGSVYGCKGAPNESWMKTFPDVNRLREIFISVRTLAKAGPVIRMTAADIEREVVRTAGGEWTEALAALAALRSMKLISSETDRLTLLPSHKIDPMNDPVYQRIQSIRNHAMGKG